MSPKQDFNDEWFAKPLLNATEQFYGVVAEHDELKDNYDELVSECAKVFLKQIKEASYDGLKEEHQYNQGFKTRLQYRLGASFALLEIFIILNRKAGRELNADCSGESAEGDYVFETLRRLHARACQISKDILTLLEAGLPTAHSHAGVRSTKQRPPATSSKKKAKRLLSASCSIRRLMTTTSSPPTRNIWRRSAMNRWTKKR